jgi:drug/metabolite transporter (DMT)-like permease
MSLFFLEPQNAANKLATNVFWGNISALASGVFFGLYFIVLRHPHFLRRNPAISVFYGNILIVLLMLPIVASNPPTQVNSNDVLAILFLGIFQIGIAYILFTHGVASGVRSLDASIIGFIEPLLNPVWVFLFVGERPSIWAVLGGAVILGAVIFHTLKQNKSKGER